MARSPSSTPRSFARPIVWAGLTVLVAAVVVLTTRSGIDILALLVAGFVLLLVERTLGDWVAESLGPVPTTLIFAAIAVLGVVYVSTDSGRGRARQLFAAADAQGYHTAYFSIDDGKRGTTTAGVIGPVSDTLATPGSAGVPVATSGAPATARPTSPAPATPRPASAAPVVRREPAPAGDGAASRDADRPSGGGASGQQARGLRITRVAVSPEVGVVGQALVLRAEVASDRSGTLPEVEFSVDGRSVATVKPDAGGVATTPWKTRVPGQYIVRARLSGGFLGGAASSATLNVLPGKH